jgi:hypothetical protein
MIVLLCQREDKSLTEGIASDLTKAFSGHIEVTLFLADERGFWTKEPSWDDLLIVAFNENPNFPQHGTDFIQDYLQKRNGNGLLLPVALKSGHARPPNVAEAFKSFVFDPVATEVRNRLVKRIGAMIGLRIQQRENTIFVSYRATDGMAIAAQLDQYLRSIGYPVWRDEAKEIDGETKILPGSQVQDQIDEALAKASILLLVDTPAAPHSRWISHEVDTANGLLLPILPLCFREKGDSKQGPRFPSLLQHQRWVSLPLPTSGTPLLKDDELASVVSQMEDYLCELIQRKCRVPFLVEREFVTRSFTWNLLDKKLLVGESVKGTGTRFPTRVLSHCSIFDHVHGPGMKAFSDFMAKLGHPNFSLYIYDGEIIPEPQLLNFIKQNPSNDGVFILHHQELAALIESNFAMKTI